MTNPLPAAADLATAVETWLSRLADERRRSDNTIAAYRRDLDGFLGFLAEHRGAAPDLAALGALSVRDVRGWLARRAAEGRAKTSTARALSAVRVFFRYLEREGIPVSSALSLVRAPKTPRGVPRPLTENQAKAVVDLNTENGGPPHWTARRDIAVLLLLYGCGLRIGEALGLDRADAPAESGALRSLTITGKGGKQRVVPVLPVVAEAIVDYLAACPHRLESGVRSSSACAASGSGPAWCSRPWRGCAARSACRPRRHRTRSATASRPICSRAAATCARSRSCSATRASRPRSATPRSTKPGSSPLTRQPTRGRDNDAG